MISPVFPYFWRAWRRERRCFHHDPTSGESFISSVLIDLGMRKMFWCKECEQHWFTW